MFPRVSLTLVVSPPVSSPVLVTFSQSFSRRLMVGKLAIAARCSSAP